MKEYFKEEFIMKTFFALTTGLLAGFIFGAYCQALVTEEKNEQEDSDKVVILD